MGWQDKIIQQVNDLRQEKEDFDKSVTQNWTPEFKYKINTPEDAFNRAQHLYSLEKAYNDAVQEYKEQHPMSPLAGVGYNPYYGIQSNPYVKQEELAHMYAVNKSGYNPKDPTAPYKEADEKFAKFARNTLVASLFAPTFIENGILGGIADIAGGTVGSYLGSEAGKYVGKELDSRFNTNWIEPTGEIIGAFAGWNPGAKLGKGITSGITQYAFNNAGKNVPKWLINPEIKISNVNWGDNAEWQRNLTDVFENNYSAKPLLQYNFAGTKPVYLQPQSKIKSLFGNNSIMSDWSGLENPETTKWHFGFEGKPKAIIEFGPVKGTASETVLTKPTVITTKEKPKFSKTMKQAFKERTGFDIESAPKEMQDRELEEWNKYVNQLRKSHK